jgi:C-terminal processing protease CtpA/Prc
MVFHLDSTREDLAVLQMGSFPNGRYKKFYRRMFRWLHQHQTTHLVIDLRYNTGGNIYNMDFLVSKIVDQPFGYQYERNRHASMGPYFNWKAKLLKSLTWIRYNFTPGFRHKKSGALNIRSCRTKPRHRDNFDGKVLSSASMCASFLKNKAAAITIGTETGGNEAGNCGGGYPKLVLPNTKFKVRFPLYHLRYDIGKPDVGRGVMPDCPTPYRIGDVLEARDLEMEKVYELLKGH